MGLLAYDNQTPQIHFIAQMEVKLSQRIQVVMFKKPISKNGFVRRGGLGWHHDFDALRFVLDFLVRIALGFLESMMMRRNL